MSKVIEICKKIAHIAHKGQIRRPGKTPYIKHVEKVVRLVGEDEELQCLAWLHDVIEDSQHTMHTLIKLGVPTGIASMVDTMTHRRNYSYANYIKDIKLQGSEVISTVKIADIVANLSDKPTDKQVLKYYQALCILC